METIQQIATALDITCKMIYEETILEAIENSKLGQTNMHGNMHLVCYELEKKGWTPRMTHPKFGKIYIKSKP